MAVDFSCFSFAYQKVQGILGDSHVAQDLGRQQKGWLAKHFFGKTRGLGVFEMEDSQQAKRLERGSPRKG